MDCGVACLAMICEYHGKSYSLEKLKTLCIATAEGVSMLNIEPGDGSLVYSGLELFKTEDDVIFE